MSETSHLKKLAIIGASGHGLVLAESAEKTAKWKHIEFYDDAFPEKTDNPPYRIQGTSETAMGLNPQEYDFALGIGNNKIRFELAQKLEHTGYSLPAIIDPSAVVSKYAQTHAGAFVAAGAVVNARTTIGKFTIINTKAVVEHDCTIADGVHISPNSSIGGTVTIGGLTWIGIGSCVKNNLSIGSNCVIGAGSVVVSSIDDNTLAYGNPAKKKQPTC
ncbi:acetyltransferase [Pelagicoccus sp. SDUM812005]|uniref:acetyltransferase n=1 Tax=Pelagicoccus sp. SDUM812005 TaxID=3041257 RepID=UPI0028102C52|nr:acetyltransferase [Pelagicoccus sp. SDUM812005]MDQ8180802.1 acetyltransferase [Pelagicoccus sp. SDUM812005]